MRWVSTAASTNHLEDALDEALDSLAADLAGATPDLVLAFAHVGYASHFSRLPRLLRRRYPGVTLLGCLAEGIIGGGEEYEQMPALSLTAAVLPGVAIHPFHLGGRPETWRSRIDVAPEQDPSFLLMPDRHTCPADVLVRWFDAVYPDSVKLGGLAGGGMDAGTTALLVGDQIVRSGAVGVALSGNIEVETAVAQACRPVGTPLFITRAEDELIFELDGVPALDAIEAIYTDLSDIEQQQFRQALFLGLATDDDRAPPEHGHFLVRDILAVEPSTGAIAVSSDIDDTRVVQLHLRDGEAASLALGGVLAECRDPAPAGALLFTGVDRGEALFGFPNHDADCLFDRYGEVPVGGFFGSGEIGPISDRERHTVVHGHAAAFALFRPASSR
ncbi:FIST signal transduction protein [Haliangium sp.]|uniref:FIST signal transduction protein n=1 Tax=Haliangium sp. TaxID=2663208 RepID=UPI003D12C661